MAKSKSSRAATKTAATTSSAPTELKGKMARPSPKRVPGKSVFRVLHDEYQAQTPRHIKLLDAFLFFLFITGVLQFVYCITLSNYPFNSFVAG